MSNDEQTEYQRLMNEYRELEKENFALRCNNLVMKEVNQALTEFHVDSSKNMIERQRHAMEFFRFLVSNDEWYSALDEDDVWEDPQAAEMIRLEIKEIEAMTHYMDAQSLRLLTEAWTLNNTMIQYLRSAQETLDGHQIDSRDIAEILDEAYSKFGTDSQSGQRIAASIAELEALVDSDAEDSGLDSSIVCEVVAADVGEHETPDIEYAAHEAEQLLGCEEGSPVHKDTYKDQGIPSLNAVQCSQEQQCK